MENAFYYGKGKGNIAINREEIVERLKKSFIAYFGKKHEGAINSCMDYCIIFEYDPDLSINQHEIARKDENDVFALDLGLDKSAFQKKAKDLDVELFKNHQQFLNYQMGLKKIDYDFLLDLEATILSCHPSMLGKDASEVRNCLYQNASKLDQFITSHAQSFINFYFIYQFFTKDRNIYSLSTDEENIGLDGDAYTEYLKVLLEAYLSYDTKPLSEDELSSIVNNFHDFDPETNTFDGLSPAEMLEKMNLRRVNDTQIRRILACAQTFNSSAHYVARMVEETQSHLNKSLRNCEIVDKIKSLNILQERDYGRIEEIVADLYSDTKAEGEYNQLNDLETDRFKDYLRIPSDAKDEVIIHEMLHCVSAKSAKDAYNPENHDYVLKDGFMFNEHKGFAINEIFTEWLTQDIFKNNARNHIIIVKEAKYGTCSYNKDFPQVASFFEENKDVLIDGYLGPNLKKPFEVFGRENFIRLVESLDSLYLLDEKYNDYISNIRGDLIVNGKVVGEEEFKRKLASLCSKYGIKPSWIHAYYRAFSKIEKSIDEINAFKQEEMQ